MTDGVGPAGDASPGAQAAGSGVLASILRLAPWAALSFILQNAYNQNDAFFLGKVSATASNALGLFMMVQIANFGVIFVLARGTQSLVGRRFGARNREGAARAYVQGLLLAARRQGLRADAVDVRNSGDTAGPRDRVVGYGAYVFA